MPLSGTKKEQAPPPARRETGPLPPTIINEKDGAELILVPAGNFLRGSLEGQGDPDERPQRDIYLDAFYIARYPVTNRQYRKFLQETGHEAPPYLNDPLYGPDDQPVVGVSWEDADAYCKWAGLRLPTEAEWEKAAAWDDQRKLKNWWPWGDTEPDPERANYANKIERPTPVGQYPLGVSPYGCHDMAGNVMEWVEDCYAYDYYEESPVENPRGPTRMQWQWKVLRGGSFKRSAGYLTASYRYWYTPSFKDEEIGFRCAQTP